MASTEQDVASASVIDNLVSILGSEHVLTDAENLEFYSTDVYRAAKEQAIAVARPGTVDELQAVVKACAAAGSAMVVRGGGASYTDGFLATRPGTVCIDAARMKGIEVNEDAMYVTVEPGVTWEEMYLEVSKRGLRTPMWGPFSGRVASVAGGMSHQAVNFGSGTYGTSSESVTSMDIILASGELLSTGSAGGEGALPFFRFYGPDLTGLFLGDAGAFGIKARITLRLFRQPEHNACASFGFPDGESALTALMEVGKLGVVAWNFGLDPRQQKTALTQMESASAIEAAWSVFKSARSPIDGALQVAKMGLAGRNFLKKAVYSAHFSCEGQTAAEARGKLAQVRKVASQYGAEVANSIPTYFNANPFMELTPILGPNGERWKPTHGVLPFSNVLNHHQDFENLVEEYRERMEQNGVQLTRMLMFFGTSNFIYEPTFLWNDAQSIYHKRVYPAALLPNVKTHPDNPDGRALVKEIKGRIQELCIKNGASHMQVGKDYPYMATRKAETAGLVRQVKAMLDPDNLMNPGALGLDID